MSAARIEALYRLRVDPQHALQRARQLAVEQSIEMPPEAVADPRVLAEVLAEVEHVEPQGDGTCLARLRLACETVGDDAGQLMNMLFGNCALQPDVELLDVDVPAQMAQVFGGPNLGVAGWRRLTGAYGRPLTCTALKPVGSTPAQLAALCRAFAQAGIDVIKDDHGWAEQRCAPFAERVAACQGAIDATRSRPGGRPLYAPRLSGTLPQLPRQVDLARAAGVRAFVIAPLLCGAATFNALKRANPDLAFMAHPAFAGGRIAAPALLGRLLRLFGADAVIFPNHGGRFSYDAPTCRGIAANCRAPWQALAPALPVPAGGMSVERVPELKREYGNDSMLLIGGGLLSAGERLAERSRAFVAAVADVDEVAA